MGVSFVDVNPREQRKEWGSLSIDTPTYQPLPSLTPISPYPTAQSPSNGYVSMADLNRESNGSGYLTPEAATKWMQDEGFGYMTQPQPVELAPAPSAPGQTGLVEEAQSGRRAAELKAQQNNLKRDLKQEYTSAAPDKARQSEIENQLTYTHRELDKLNENRAESKRQELDAVTQELKDVRAEQARYVSGNASYDDKYVKLPALRQKEQELESRRRALVADVRSVGGKLSTQEKLTQLGTDISDFAESFLTGGGNQAWGNVFGVLSAADETIGNSLSRLMYLLTGDEAYSTPVRSEMRDYAEQHQEVASDLAQRVNEGRGYIGRQLMQGAAAGGSMLFTGSLAGLGAGSGAGMGAQFVAPEAGLGASAMQTAASRIAGVGARLGNELLTHSGNALISAGSAGSTYIQATDKGANSQQALANAIGAGLLEYFSNKLFSGTPIENSPEEKGYVTQLVELIAKKIGKDEALESFFKSAGGQVAEWITDKIGEGLEEVVTELGDPVIERITWNPDADRATAEEVADAFVGGVVLSLIMGGGEALMQTAEKAQNKVAVRRATKELQRVVSDAMKQTPAVLDTATSAYVDAGKQSLNSAQKKAAVVDKAWSGQTLTADDINTLALNNPVLRDTFNKLTGLHLGEGDEAAVTAFNRSLRDPVGRAAVAEEIRSGIQEQKVAAVFAFAGQKARETAQRKAFWQRQNATVSPEWAAQLGEQGRTLPGIRSGLSLEQFTEAYRSRPEFAKASDKAVERAFNDFLKSLDTANGLDDNAREAWRWQKMPELGNVQIDTQAGPMNLPQFVQFVRQSAPGGKAATTQEIAEYFLNIAAQTGKINQSEYNKYMEVIDDGGRGQASGNGTGLYGRSDERSDRRAAGVSENAGGAEASVRGRGTADDAGRGSGSGRDGGRDLGRGSREEAVSDLPTRAIKDGKGRVVMQRVTDEAFNSTDAGKELTELYGSIGVEVGGMLGLIPIYDGDTVVAVANGDTKLGIRSIVRMDDPRYNYRQLGGHELGHQVFYLDPGSFARAKDALVKALSPEEFHRLMRAYAKAFADAYRADYARAGVELTKDMLKDLLVEEMLCDAYGRMDRGGTNASQYYDAVAPAIETARQDIANAREVGEVDEDQLQSQETAGEGMIDALAANDIEAATKYSTTSMGQAAGLTAHKAEDGSVYFTDESGKRVTAVTADYIKTKTPIGAVITYAAQKGWLGRGKAANTANAAKQYEFFADFCNLLSGNGDFAMTSAFVGATTFTALKANSDDQYRTTYDFKSVCIKTQACIDAMSKAMVRLQRGLTNDEIEDLYNEVFHAGNPVPCPECYVWSRWVGVGGLLENIWTYQNKYGQMSTQDVIASYNEMYAKVEQAAREADLSFGKAKTKMFDQIQKQYNKLLEKIELAQNTGAAVSDEDVENLATLERMMTDVKALTWIKNVYFGGKAMNEKNVNPDYAVPVDVLFDLRRGAEFSSTKYRAAWTFRTTQGNAFGKAITPYADAVLGEGILGSVGDIKNTIQGKADGTLKNPILDSKGELTTDAQKKLNAAVKNQKKQLFRGGQRFSSTSDAANDVTTDFILALLEMQTMHGGVQIYTKVSGAVQMLATVGAYINQSLMPLGGGLTEDGQLRDTSVGGMPRDVAFENRKKYPTAGTITIGVNDNHIRALFRQINRDFIIPYHASGGNAEMVAEFRRVQDPDAAKTQVRSTDYTRTQNEKILSDLLLRDHFGYDAARIQQIHKNREARIAILTGKSPDMSVVTANPILMELYNRFHGGEWEGVTLPKKEIEARIYPNEFWDETVDYEHSGRNTQLYLDYCEALGLLHKFSGTYPQSRKLKGGGTTSELRVAKGYDENGNEVELTDLAYVYKDGKKTSQIEDFFWKTLIDHRMYDNEGKYQKQGAINLSNLSVVTAENFAKHNAGRQYDAQLSAETAEKIADMLAMNPATEAQAEKLRAQTDVDTGTRHSVADETTVLSSLDQDFLDTARRMYEGIEARKRWTGDDTQILRDFYESHPEYDFVRRIALKDKTARADLKKLLSGINDMAMLEKMSWYTTRDHWTPNGEYRGAMTSVANIYKAHMKELVAQKVNGHKIELEHRRYELSEARDLFNQLNSNEALSKLADKVFTVAERFPIEILASNQSLGSNIGAHTAGLNSGATIWLKKNYFANPAFSDQRKAGTILHEMIHALTIYAISDDYRNDHIFSDPGIQKAVDMLEKVYNEVKVDPAFKGDYGVKNLKEFVAELANVDFREKLAKKNLLQRVVEAIRTFFGIEKETALDGASAALDYLLDHADDDGINSYHSDILQRMQRYEQRTGRSRYSVADELPDLTEAQEKNRNFNNLQTEVGKPLKTLNGKKPLGRYKGIVGKDIDAKTYVHKDYAEEVIPVELLHKAERILQREYPDFSYNTVMHDRKANTIRFDEAPDFDTAREPIPGNYVTVDPKTGETKTGHSDYIWHHKWMWVKNDYTGFDVPESWNWSKQWLNVLRPTEDKVSNRGIANGSGHGTANWNKQLDYFGLPRDEALRTRYSLAPVDPVQPSSDKWQRSQTVEEVRAEHPTLFDLVAEESEKRNPTQTTSTVKTYRKIYDALRQEGFSGTILDASSGLGLGTDIGRKEFDYDVDDIEPYPDEGYTPRYKDYSIFDKKYDVVINNAVLNVLPQDLRDAMVAKIGQMLNPGGRAFINVRGDDVKTAKTKVPINESQMEYFIQDGNSYQKGFKPQELKAYLEDVLGDGFTVKLTKDFGKVAAIVTKDTEPAAKYSVSSEPTYNQTALLNESTVDKYLQDYAAKSSPNYAQAYIAWMSPQDFLDLTTSKQGRARIENETDALDVEKLGEATRHNPFQLRIDHTTGEVNGHEGRHRANALLRAGVERIPVLLFDSSNKYDKAPISELTLKGQDFGNARSNASVTAHDLIPLSYANRDQIVREFGTQPTMERMNERYNGAETVRYSVSPPEDSEAFRNWFKDSKAVNEDGTPRVMYHGTSRSGFNMFDTYGSKFGLFGIGSYFTDNPDVASGYTKKGRGKAPGIYPVYLSVQNPIDMDAPVDIGKWKQAFRGQGWDGNDLDGVKTNSDAWSAMLFNIEDEEVPQWEGAETAQDVLRGMGYDGITHIGGLRAGKDSGIQHRVFIVFDPEQVKSVYNQGTWDQNRADIRYSVSPELEQWFELQKQYGTMPESKGSVRPAEVPRQTAKTNKVSRTAATVMGAQATPDSRLDTIAQAVVDDKLSYTPITNKLTVNKARNKLKLRGWSDSVREWTDAVNQGRSGADLVAMGAELLNNAGNNSASGEEYVDLLTTYADLLRRAGQTVQAAKILQKLTPEGRLYGIQRTIRKMNEKAQEKAKPGDFDPTTGEFNGITLDPGLVEEYNNATTDEERDEIIDRMAQDVANKTRTSWWDRLTAWRYLNMLGNFRTQVRNVLGNAGFQGPRMLKDSIAGLTEAALQKLGRPIDRTTSVLRDRETWKAAGEIFKEYQDAILAGGKYQDDTGLDFAGLVQGKRRIFGNTKYKLWNKTAGAALEKYRTAANWAMDKGDALFCSFTFRDSLARFMAANNTTWSEASEELKTRAVNKAVRDAAEATYRDNNAIATYLSRAMRGENVPTIFKVLGEGIMPFRKTPANILMRSYEYSPLSIIGNTVTAIQAATGRKTVSANEIVDQWAKTFTGTGLMMLGYALASMGMLIGKAPDDDDEKNLFQQEGNQAYALKANGHTYTLDWAAPEAIPLFLGANLAQEGLKNGLSLKDGLDAIMAVGDPLFEMSMLQGINDALESVGTYGVKNALASFVANAALSYASQFGSNTLLGQLERGVNNTRMQTYVDKNGTLPQELQRQVGKWSAKTPGWDYNQILYIDPWGDPQNNADTETWNLITQLFSPSYVSTMEQSATLDELSRLYDATGEGSVILDPAKKYFTVDGQKKDLTADEYLTYAITRGQTAKRLMADLISSEGYALLNDDEKVTAISKVYDYANQMGKAAVSSFQPESWAGKMQTGAAEHDIPEATYTNLYAASKDVDSLKDAKGDTVENSKSLQIMQMIYDVPGLTKDQQQYLAESLGVGKTVRGYSAAMVNSKLSAMEKKYAKYNPRQAARTTYGLGNIDLTNRPMYQNPDGTISTVDSIGVNIDGMEMVLPTIDYDKAGNPIRLSEDEAIDRYRRTGEYLGKFRTVEEANEYAQILHEEQAKMYAR